MSKSVFSKVKAVLIAEKGKPSQPIFAQAINITIKHMLDADVKKTLAGTFVANNFGYMPVVIQLTCVSVLAASSDSTCTEKAPIYKIQNLRQKVYQDYFKQDQLKLYTITIGKTVYSGYILNVTQTNDAKFPGISLITLYIVGQKAP